MNHFLTFLLLSIGTTLSCSALIVNIIWRMSRAAHACAVYDAYSGLNIVHSKVTYAGRQNGRQLLEKAGVEKVSADVAGG